MTKMLSPEGLSGFSSVDQARGFKGAEEQKKYSQELLLPREEGLKFLQDLTDAAGPIRDKMYERAKASGKPVRATPVDIPYKELGDSLAFSFRRKEQDGAPMIVDQHNNPYTGKIWRHQNTVQVAFEITPYTIQNKISFTLKLLGVKVLGGDNQALTDLFGAPTKPAEEPKKPESPADLF